MAKLYARWGAMGGGKSLQAIATKLNYDKKKMKTVILVPALDTRFGEGKVTSRNGDQINAIAIKPEDNVYNIISDIIITDKINCIICDESQFFSPHHIDELSDIVDYLQIPVICFALRSDFQTLMFPGSKRLFELADEIEEIPSVCWCGRKARYNARTVDGSVIKEGEQVQIGDAEYYGLCRYHYKEGMISGDI